LFIHSTYSNYFIAKEPNNEQGKKKIGIVVDHVAEVIEIKNSELEDFEEDLVDDLNAFINGIAKMKDKIIIIIDIVKIVNNVETVEVN
jgi:chemotaxis signal transduction protein